MTENKFIFVILCIVSLTIAFFTGAFTDKNYILPVRNSLEIKPLQPGMLISSSGRPMEYADHNIDDNGNFHGVDDDKMIVVDPPPYLFIPETVDEYARHKREGKMHDTLEPLLSSPLEPNVGEDKK